MTTIDNTHSKDARKTYSIDARSEAQWVYLDSPANGEVRLGVSLSGGGTRSASYATGVIQRLIKDGVFERIQHLAAISGGTYAAGGMAVTCGESDKNALDGPPWQNGSDEEARLRLSTTFLSSGPQEAVWLFVNVLYGFLLNLLPLCLCAFIAGRVCGELIGRFHGGTIKFNNGGISIDQWFSKFTMPLAGLLLFCIVIVALRRIFDRSKLQADDELLVQLVRTNYVASMTIAFVLFVAVMPYLIVYTQLPIEYIIGLFNITGLNFSPSVNIVIAALILIVSVSVLGFLFIFLAANYRRLRFLGIPATLAGPTILMIPFLLAAHTSGFAQKLNPEGIDLQVQLLQLIAAILLVIVFGVVVHNRRYSLHLFYRERLQKAFVFRRHADSKTNTSKVDALPYNKELPLSNYSTENLSTDSFSFPNVIYCSAVAANRTKAPYRRNAGSYTFESDWCGGPLVGYVKTKFLEREYAQGGTALTIPSLMAISGAAVSPLMGRYGSPALRFLFALLNLRLGVWIPHRRALNIQRSVSANSSTDDKSVESHRFFDKAKEFIVRGWQEPGALYVMFEALGITRSKDNYSYVSDGGHWENLGIVELLRRRCSHIIVVDASTTETDLSDELARSVRLANSELGVDVSFDFSTLKRESDELPKLPYAIGKFVYPDGEEGNLLFLRSTLWESAPFELTSLERVDKHFPHHPTSNQYLSGEQFDGYRRLGWAAAGYVKEDWPIKGDAERTATEGSIL